MSDNDLDVLDARRRVDALTRTRVRAEHDYDAAKAHVRKLLAELEEEHGVTDAEQARQRLAALEAELSTALDELRQALDQAGVQ